MITSSSVIKSRAFHAVNTELIDLYWQVGEYISRKLETATWGEGVVDRLARYIARQQPDIKGFTRRNLFRMRQFYETYRSDKKVAPLVRQLSWTHNLLILSRSKRSEEREFYLRLCLREHWSKRELERQLSSTLFERTVLAPLKVSPPVAQLHPDATVLFKDTYLLDFLDLPEKHDEADLQHHADTRVRFDRVAHLVEGFETPFGMELLATVHWVATREESGSVDEAIEKTYAWNSRKRMFDPAQIRIAWDVLHQKGWLGVSLTAEV